MGRKVIGRALTSSTATTSATVTSSGGAHAAPIIEKSPIDGRPIKWEVVTLKSDEIWDRCYKTIYNTRSFEDLSKVSVMDIYPSIKTSNGNSEPVRAVKSGDKYEILGGVRRSYTVSLINSAELYMLVAAELSEEEKSSYAKIMDEYEKPCIWDQAISTRKLKETLQKKQGDTSVNVRRLSKLLGLSKSWVAEGLKYSELPSSVGKLFPSTKYLTKSLLDSLFKYQASGGDVNEIVDTYKFEIDEEILENTDSEKYDLEITKIEKIIKERQKEILNFIKNPTKEPESSKSFLQISEIAIQGVKIKNQRKGFRLDINEETIEEELLEDIIQLLTNKE